MNLIEIASAFADTVKPTAVLPESAQSEWWKPGFVGGIIGALIAVLGAFLLNWYNRRKDRLKDEKERKKVLATDESRYLDWIIREHRFLAIAGLRTRAPVDVELERVYVSLSVDPRSLEKMGIEPKEAQFPESREEQKVLTIADALAFTDDGAPGVVILGGPGTGKTTLLKYLALTYAKGLHGERLERPRPLLPLFVTLREITETNRNQGLADYLAGVCEGVGCKVSPGFFDKKLRDGDCIILLDGLDEVADETQRSQVAKWIRTQCNVWGNNPFIVTCRVAGFQEEYLPKRFVRLDIRDFDEKDIAQFARNWCVTVETMLSGDSDETRRKGEQAGEKLIRAIQSNDRVKELAVNPLMLSIIALVHRYRATLPDRRVELYAECVEVLLGHWDKAKEMKVSISPGKALQVLQPLALWMHEQRQGAEGEQLAHRDEIKPVIAPHLVSIGLGEVGEFLDSIRDRSGLLVERGLDVFGFQHQTFQEYLSAREIAEREKVEMLISHFGDAHWREVTLLCAGMGDASELVNGILSLPSETVTEHWRFLLQIREEALAIDEKTREALVARPLDILKQATDPTLAVRAALYLRREKPDVETLMRAFDEVKDESELAKGHLALLLGETGDAKAVETLKPHLTDEDRHVRVLSALALELLGFDEGKILEDILMVKVASGEFTMGGKQVWEEDTPHRIISTDAFLMDRFPLTNAQYQRFIDDGGYEKRGYWSKEGWKWKEEYDVSEPRFRNNPEFSVLSAPVVGISWYEAEAYAKWAGKRLPTEQEWERAARGDRDAREYPWGEDFEKDRCNSEMVIGKTPVGSYPGGISPHGCYDMAGNVWEWTESLYEKGERYRVVRGGSWSNPHDLARCAVRLRFHPDDWYGDVGVRFSRTP